ncbi:MAG TPA: DUF971 domain-containing protein [Anaeromyxobacter sp.]
MGLLDEISFQKRDPDPPEAIDLVEGGVRIQWPGGAEVTIPFVHLRDACPCAECVDERTGEKLVQLASIPPDIRPEQVVAVGNYAVQIHWSDGHSTGIYSWRTLREISGLEG